MFFLSRDHGVIVTAIGRTRRALQKRLDLLNQLAVIGRNRWPKTANHMTVFIDQIFMEVPFGKLASLLPSA